MRIEDHYSNVLTLYMYIASIWNKQLKISLNNWQIFEFLLGCIDPDLHGRDEDKHHVVLPAVARTQHPLEGRNIRGR